MRFRGAASFLFLPFLLLAATLQAQPSGADLYKSGEYEQARTILEQQLEQGNGTADTRFWLGYTYLALGARDRAIPHFEAYLAANPDDEDVLYALARSYSQLAEMSLQQIFRIDPASARSYQMRGIRFELEKAWPEAIQQYRKAAELNPKLPGLHSSIGRILDRDLKDAEAADEAYRRELSVFPLSREANEYLAREHGDQRARKILDSCYVPEASACPATAGGDRIMLLLARNRPQEALADLLSWRSRDSENPDVYYLLGEAFTDLKVDTIRRLRTARPESFRLHQLLAESYASTHRKPEAIEEYRQALALAPRTPGIHFELGRLLADTEAERAVEHLKAELETDPDHYLAKSLLGRIYVVLGKPEPAIPLLEQVLTARPSLLEARKALGQALALQGEFERALALYDAFSAEQPLDEQIHFLRAQALQGLGRSEEASEARKRHQAVLKQIRDEAR